MVVAFLLLTANSLHAVEGKPYPLAVAGMGGKLYVADRANASVWLVEGGAAKPFFSGSPKFRTPLNAVRCVAMASDGTLYAGDSSTRDVYRFDETTKPIALTGGKIGIPMDIAIGSGGELYVADLELHTIFRVDTKTGTAQSFVNVPAPRGIAIDSQNQLLVVSHGKSPLLRIKADKTVEAVVEEPLFQFAHQVRVNAGGDAFVSDGYGKCIWRVPASGKPTKLDSGDKLVNPVGLHLEGDSLWIADPRASALFRWDLRNPTSETLEVVHAFGDR
jgi:sugar lactone lactonase YvrE